MQIFSVVLFILLSISLFVYLCFSFGLKIKQNRKYRNKVKELKGTDLTKKEKYTFAKFMTIFEGQIRENQEKQKQKDSKESK